MVSEAAEPVLLQWTVKAILVRTQKSRKLYTERFCYLRDYLQGHQQDVGGIVEGKGCVRSSR